MNREEMVTLFMEKAAAAATITNLRQFASVPDASRMPRQAGKSWAGAAEAAPGVLPAERIYATLDDFFQSIMGNPPTNITLITGPSRTADIELTLAIGVHGPERLDVLVV